MLAIRCSERVTTRGWAVSFLLSPSAAMTTAVDFGGVLLIAACHRMFHTTALLNALVELKVDEDALCADEVVMKSAIRGQTSHVEFVLIEDAVLNQGEISHHEPVITSARLFVLLLGTRALLPMLPRGSPFSRSSAYTRPTSRNSLALSSGTVSFS